MVRGITEAYTVGWADVTDFFSTNKHIGGVVRILSCEPGALECVASILARVTQVGGRWTVPINTARGDPGAVKHNSVLREGSYS